MKIYELLKAIDSKLPFENVSAHCDIPCKIYDPITAQLAVLTMIRMVDLLKELEQKASLTFAEQATFQRLIAEKEEHGRKVKDEIGVIWGDFIKQAQLEKYPELHSLTHDIMLTASAAKQQIDREVTVKLLDKVNKFAEIFWNVRGVSVYTAACPYPPSETLVYPELKG